MVCLLCYCCTGYWGWFVYCVTVVQGTGDGLFTTFDSMTLRTFSNLGIYVFFKTRIKVYIYIYIYIYNSSLK
jgi:hypothetical protein